ncbi:mannosyltransferase family protein [Conexibacter sp. JD483]|uniref:mannosyltransferase family protein n=1 Tax=unclassified Conexibacter TaxID=2627773 RepID=UPI00271D9740|nr:MULTISPECIES: mannosyltransferase family protein [unclassified Conexibacter]MDO8184390.1 mannosyltransferase family protein [Conexibacter sp. CPCC 205706]MDO8197696.1 mannosyltransferase family protein [Conexibacter sp. CPCC 205762]MDR9368359.1 mannosyltransferase family protein [Conexibacter sp. JD483]
MERQPVGSVRAAWQVLWSSRAVVWAAGLLGLLWLGEAPNADQFDPGALTRPFSPFGNLLVAPAARWDAVWYLAIARDGYSDTVDGAKAAFYPLYPLLTKGAGWVVGSTLAAGVLISIVSFFGALVLLHQLAALELGERGARHTLLLVAFFPASFFFSAVYAESLFLLLSVAAVLSARRGLWMWAGIAAALATLTRNSGAVLLVPLLLLFLYGPREDRPPREREESGRWSRWAPRYPLTPQLLWLALVPLALAGYLAYCGIVLDDLFAPFGAQGLWGRHLVPLGGIWEGARAAWLGLRQVGAGTATPVYFSDAGGDPLANAGQNLMLFGFLVFALVALVGALRRLPIAYGAYALVALVLTLSYPVDAQPLMSLPRFLAVLFPLHMWLAKRLGERGDGAVERGVAISAVLLGLLTVQFARWGFVA